MVKTFRNSRQMLYVCYIGLCTRTHVYTYFYKIKILLHGINELETFILKTIKRISEEKN